jgi:hypothetical protein
MSKQKLKIGLIIDGYHVPNWVYEMIKEVCESDYLEIVLVISKTAKKHKHNIFLNKIRNSKNSILFNLYLKFENKLFCKHFNAFQIKNIKHLIDCDEILISAVKNIQLNHVFNNKQINLIKSKQLDVIIRIGFKGLENLLLKFTKHGIWYYRHGNYNVISDNLSGVWETFKKNNDTKVSLNVIKMNVQNELIVYETAFNTDHLFIWRTRNVIFWNSKSILKRKLNELYLFGDDLFFQKATLKQTPKINNTLYKTPSNIETLRYVLKLYFLAIRKVIKRQFYFDQWILLFNLEQNQKLDKSFKKYTRLLPPKDRFWADPFILKNNDYFYIFLEELLYSENRGKISVIIMDNKGNYTQPKVVLETDYHLSYPFLIEDNGQLYMLPETQQNNSIELYKCVEFPHKWKLELILFKDLKAVDSTIFKYNNKYWLFTNLTEYKGEHVINELFLFYSDSLLNNSWTCHPQNPINTDHAYSRPAGNIFIHEDRLYRPAQNCSKHYGYAIQIQEILKLTENEYEEKNIETIYPNWDSDLLSTHTLNKSENLTVIDAKISRKKRFFL